MVLDASKTNSRGNAHNLTDFCNEKKRLWMRPKPFLYINLDNLTDLSTEKMVLDASKTNSRGNAYNLTGFCNEKVALDASKTIPRQTWTI